jgi:phosphate-selective porin
MNTTIKSMLIAAAALTAVSSYAQDKSTLDLLVKKGIITAEERAVALQSASESRAAAGLNKIFVKEDATKRLTFSGRVQTQYESIGGDVTTSAGVNSEVTDVSTAFMRRLYLGFKADMGEGISAEIVNNFADNSLDKAIFTAETTYGTFILGYQKVQWGLEENTSSSKLLTVERSASNRFWNEGVSSSARLGFGARHTGLHYSNKYLVDTAQTLEYGFSVANALQGQGTSTGNNDVGTWANLIYSYKISDTNRHSIGVNYGAARDSRDNTAIATGAGITGNDAQIKGFNPYIKSQFDKLIVQAEMISTTNEARGATATTIERKPKGYTALAAYKFTDQIEGVIRYSQLDTDGQGANFSGLYRDAAAFSSSVFYNKFDSIYYGVNYYFVDHNAKIMLGYENAKATERLGSTSSATGTSALGGVVGSGKADANIFRLQAQVLF